MNPVFVRALDEIRKNGGLLHPNDFDRTVDLLDLLIEAGQRVQRPNDIHEYLEKQGMNSTVAEQVQTIYETLRVLRDGKYKFGDSVIEKVLRG